MVFRNVKDSKVEQVINLVSGERSGRSKGTKVDGVTSNIRMVAYSVHYIVVISNLLVHD